MVYSCNIFFEFYLGIYSASSILKFLSIDRKDVSETVNTPLKHFKGMVGGPKILEAMGSGNASKERASFPVFALFLTLLRFFSVNPHLRGGWQV